MKKKFSKLTDIEFFDKNLNSVGELIKSVACHHMTWKALTRRLEAPDCPGYVSMDKMTPGLRKAIQRKGKIPAHAAYFQN